MGSNEFGLGEILASVNNESDLNGNNVIDKIKSKLKEESKFDINCPFFVRDSYPNQDSTTVTLLYVATAINATNLVRALLEVEGINVDKGSIAKLTPLQLAAMEGYKEIAEILIRKGADVKAKDDNGWTPLHYAANEYSEATVLTLIMEGVDPWLKNRSGKTPVDIYTSKYPNGSGYLAQLKKAKNRSTIVFYLVLSLGAVIVVSTFAVGMIAPGIIASTVVAPYILYVIGAVMFVLAFIAKHVTYKVCEPSAKIGETKTNTKEEMDDKKE